MQAVNWNLPRKLKKHDFAGKKNLVPSKIDTYVVFLALVKITLVNAYMHIYCYCMNQGVGVYLHVHMIIYTVIVHSSRLYT